MNDAALDLDDLIHAVSWAAQRWTDFAQGAALDSDRLRLLASLLPDAGDGSDLPWAAPHPMQGPAGRVLRAIWRRHARGGESPGGAVALADFGALVAWEARTGDGLAPFLVELDQTPAVVWGD